MRVYDKHTIILNSYEDNVELLEKRSAIYSDRPRNPMMQLSVLSCWSWSKLAHSLLRHSMRLTTFSTGLLRYGPDWRAHRRIFQRFFKPEAMFKFRQVRVRKNIEFLYSLLDSPQDFAAHIRMCVLIFSVPDGITYCMYQSSRGNYCCNYIWARYFAKGWLLSQTCTKSFSKYFCCSS